MLNKGARYGTTSVDKTVVKRTPQTPSRVRVIAKTSLKRTAVTFESDKSEETPIRMAEGNAIFSPKRVERVRLLEPNKNLQLMKLKSEEVTITKKQKQVILNRNQVQKQIFQT